MPLTLNCIEPLTAICIGVGACALAPFDAGLTAGAVIGGAGLFVRIREGLRKPGLDEPDIFRRLQKEVLRDWDHWQNTQERRDAVTLADAAMTRWLPTVMMTREELAATATESGRDDERYPVIAARKIADRLGDHDPEFKAPKEGQPESLARQFACDVIKRALRAAKNDRDYATFLTLDIAIELGRATEENRLYLEQIKSIVADTRADVADIKKDVGALPEQIAQAVAAQLGAMMGEGAVQLTQIRTDVRAALMDRPEASEEDIVSQVAYLIRSRAEALAQLEALPVAEDNRLRSLQVAVEQALAASDDEAALTALDAEESAYAEQEQVAATKRAGIAGTRATLLLGRGDWQSADAEWTRAENLLAPFDRAAADTLVWQATDKLLDHGEIFGARGALDAVITRARAMQARLQGAADRAGFASWSIWLGNALQTQGARTGGEAGLVLLADAVAAYRAALAVYTESAMPAQWATTQNNLGIALKTQGARTGGEAGLALLADAVAAYRAAMTVRTESAMPAQWATTQNNLGTALRAQGERTGGAAGLALLADAVAAYRASLTVRTEIAMPADWAMTQENIALAFEAMAARRDDPLPELHEAEVAVLAALTVYTPEHMPFYHEKAIRLLTRIRAKLAEHGR